MPSDEKSLVRWIIKLPNSIFFEEDYARNSVFFSLSDDYFDKGRSYFDYTLSSPDQQLSSRLFFFLYDQAKQHFIINPGLRYYILFDECYPEIDNFYSRVIDCQPKGIELDNLISYLYVYLEPNTAKNFTEELQKGLDELQQEVNFNFAVYEASVQPVAGESISALPVQPYQTLMDIPAGWAYPGGKGQWANCFVIENGWGRGNPELPDYINRNQTRQTLENLPIEALIDGPLNVGSDLHGTQTLGVLTARHDYIATPDRLGIVPEATIVKLISGYVTLASLPLPDYKLRPEAALLKAICKAGRGDVILIEYEYKTNNLPLETKEPNWKLIWYATHCLDITIIEPAGNVKSGKDDGGSIDSFLQTPDSGAILVGAAREQGIAYYNKRGFSIRAIQESRFCYAPVPLLTIVPEKYDQTSAASAVIAGIACQIQSIYKARFVGSERANFLPPAVLRGLLCGANNGTAVQLTDESTVVGIIPNLKQIIEQL